MGSKDFFKKITVKSKSISTKNFVIFAIVTFIFSVASALLIYLPSYALDGIAGSTKSTLMTLGLVSAIVAGVFGVFALKNSDTTLKTIISIVAMFMPILFMIAIYVMVWVATLLFRLGKDDNGTSSNVRKESHRYVIKDNVIERDYQVIAKLEPHLLDEHLTVVKDYKEIGCFNTKTGNVFDVKNTSFVLMEGRVLFNENYANIRGQTQSDYIARAAIWIIENLG